MSVLIASARFDNSAAADGSSDGVFSLIDVLSSSRLKPVIRALLLKTRTAICTGAGKSDKTPLKVKFLRE